MNIRQPSARFTMPIVSLIAVVLVFLLLWNLLSFLLSNGVGLEWFDEALYIQAASHGYESASFYHQFPWEWQTRPLLLAVGGQVDAFRTVGAVILFMSACLLGISLGAFSSSYRDRPMRGALSFNSLLLSAVLGVSSLTYYSGMLRAPSYNWVTIVGLLIALSGLLFYVTELLRAPTPGVGRWRVLSAGLLSASGMVFSVPAKPTTAIFVFAAGFLAVAVGFGLRAGLKWLQISGLAASGTIAALILVRLWPLDAISRLYGALTRPRLSDFNYFKDCSIDSAIGVRGAIENFLCVPETFVLGLAALPVDQFLVFAAAFAMLAIFHFAQDRLQTLRILPGIALLGVGFWVSIAPSFDGLSYVGAQRWALTPEQTTGAILFVIAATYLTSPNPASQFNRNLAIVSATLSMALIVGIRRDLIPELAILPVTVVTLVALLVAVRPSLFWSRTTESVRRLTRQPRRKRPENLPILFAGIGAVSPFVVGFGSSLGAFRIAAIATVFFTFSALVLLSSSRRKTASRVGLATLGVASVVLSTVVLYDGHLKPWGTSSLKSPKVATSLGENLGVLWLDPDTSIVLTKILADSKYAGWTRNTEMVSYSRSGLLIPMLLGAKVVPSLTLSLNWNLQEARDNFEAAEASGYEFDEAWVLTTTHEFASDLDRDNQRSMLELGREIVGLNFPTDYALVSSSGGFQLWKPLVAQPFSGTYD